MFASQADRRKTRDSTETLKLPPQEVLLLNFQFSSVTVEKATKTLGKPNIEPVVGLPFLLTSTSNDNACHVTKS